MQSRLTGTAEERPFQAVQVRRCIRFGFINQRRNAIVNLQKATRRFFVSARPTGSSRLSRLGSLSVISQRGGRMCAACVFPPRTSATTSARRIPENSIHREPLLSGKSGRIRPARQECRRLTNCRVRTRILGHDGGMRNGER